MALKSKPAAIKVQPRHLTKECVGCEVEWLKNGNPFDKKDAYLVDWDDESYVTIKLKSGSKKHKVPYEHVILHCIQLERGWIFDGGTKMAVTPEMRDPYYLTHIDEPEAHGDNGQQQNQDQEQKEKPIKESPPEQNKQQKKSSSSQTKQKKEQTPKKSQQSKSKTTNTSKQSPSKKTSSTNKSTTRKQKGGSNAFVKSSSKKPSLKNNLV